MMDPKFESSLKTPFEVAERLLAIDKDIEEANDRVDEAQEAVWVIESERSMLKDMCTHVLPNGTSALFYPNPRSSDDQFCRVCCRKYEEPPTEMPAESMTTPVKWAVNPKTGKRHKQP